MDLNVIAMDATEAEKAFRAYRGEFLAHRNRIDGELMKGYKAISEGKKLISLTEAIIAGGLNDQGLPRIAINQADEEFVMLDVNGSGDATFYNGRSRHSLTVRGIPDLTRSKWNQRAVMPIIPPQYRPPYNLSNYHLLWEVDKWTTAPQPRRDPALLKHIGGDLYAVLAVWDLTELESRILGLLRQ
jgi:hypothetical protein